VIAATSVVAVVVAGAIYGSWELGKVSVPDVTGMPLTSAIQELTAEGLIVDTGTFEAGDWGDFTTVTSINPAPGTRLRPKSTVKLDAAFIQVTVPKLSEPGTLQHVTSILRDSGLDSEVSLASIDVQGDPALAGADFESLRALLKAAGIDGTPDVSGTPFSATVSDAFLQGGRYRVAIAADEAGTQKTPGTRVDLVVVPTLTVVPSVVGMNVSDATAALAKAQLHAKIDTSVDGPLLVQAQTSSPGAPAFMDDQIALTTAVDLTQFVGVDSTALAQTLNSPSSHKGSNIVIYGRVDQLDLGKCTIQLDASWREEKYDDRYDDATSVSVAGPGAGSQCPLTSPVGQGDVVQLWVTVTGGGKLGTVWQEQQLPRPIALTAAQKQAVRSAQSYLDFTNFSRQGLIDQLSSEYGDQFAVEDATVAVDSLDVDWYAQAVGEAKSYLDFTSFSCNGLVNQLSSKYGSKFTMDQARYGAQQAGVC